MTSIYSHGIISFQILNDDEIKMDIPSYSVVQSPPLLRGKKYLENITLAIKLSQHLLKSHIRIYQLSSSAIAHPWKPQFSKTTNGRRFLRPKRILYATVGSLSAVSWPVSTSFLFGRPIVLLRWPRISFHPKKFTWTISSFYWKLMRENMKYLFVQICTPFTFFHLFSMQNF